MMSRMYALPHFTSFPQGSILSKDIIMIAPKDDSALNFYSFTTDRDYGLHLILKIN